MICINVIPIAHGDTARDVLFVGRCGRTGIAYMISKTEHQRPVVVVVDDDEAVRDSLRFLLETAGFDVDTFESACQFLSKAYDERPACLLVDQHMPRVTGRDLLQRLRASGRTLPTALMTGSPSADLARRARELGVDEVMEKPLPDEVLFRFICRLTH